MITLAGVKTPAKTILRPVMPLAIGALCLWLLQDQISAQNLSGLGAALSNLMPHQWVLAGLATVASFWAIGRYDVLLHQHLCIACRPQHAFTSGLAAIAIGQTVGFGLFSGAAVRWRLIPEMSFATAMQIALGVTLSFLLGLTFCIGLAGLLFPSRLVSAVDGLWIMGGMLIFCGICALWPRLGIVACRWRCPSLRMIGAIAMLTLIDTLFAGTALWLLMPPGSGVSFTLLMPAYLLALGAALLGGTPGGVGPFELILLSLLHDLPQVDVLCGIVAFRLLYYAVPFCLAALLLLRPFSPSGPDHRIRFASQQHDLSTAPRAEMGLCRQRHAGIIQSGGVTLPVVRPGQSLCLLFAPLKGPNTIALQTLRAAARRETLLPMVYKADARLAAVAKKSGWAVLHVADELVLRPSDHHTNGRLYRQLRRKLRQAQAAGLILSQADAPPWSVMATIDSAWQANNKAARGTTMGKFCPDYMRHQAVFLARHNGRLIGFVSFHITQNEWCLDLMRTSPGAPDGTTHALIHKAIEAAKQAGIDRFSLAALPPTRGLVAWAAAQTGQSDGLAQFKQCFRPHRRPLYASAPGWVGLLLGLADLWLSIRWPNRNLAHNHHEDYEFARARPV